MNGKNISDHDAKKWLLNNDGSVCNYNDTATSSSINNADLIILSLQECPSFPNTANNSYQKGGIQRETIPCVSVLGPPITDDANEDDKLPSTIQKILSDDFSLIVDIAMGEGAGTVLVNRENCLNGPSLESSERGNGQIVERWFGFIRLMIYAKSGKCEGILIENQLE